MMKNLWLLFTAVFLMIGLQSCKKNQVSPADLSDDETMDLIVAESTTNEVINLVDSYFDETASRSSQAGFLPSCVTVTRVLHGDTLSVTWQFDPAGCQMPNGRVYTGTVEIVRIRDRQTHEKHLYVSFSDDFSVNNIDVDGGFERIRVRRNAQNHPEAEIVFDLTVTRPNGAMMHTEGTRTREFVEGFTTRNPHDNVWLITGQWTTTRFNGNQFDVQITQPLRKEFDCRWYVSGTMEIVKNGHTFILDFGNGDCDNEALLTLPNGRTRTIHLR